MFYFLRSTLALVIVFLLAACQASSAPESPVIDGSGRLISETRAVSGFKAVDLNAFGTLTITQGEEEGLEISAEDNVMPLISSDVSDGTLLIKMNGTLNTTRGVIFRLKVKDLEAITISGAGGVKRSKLEGDTLSVRLLGAGSVELFGTVRAQNVEIAGAGAYNAPELASEEATVTIDGFGSAIVQVSKRLDATVNGAGSVEYIGSPEITENVSGLGTVRARQ